MNDDPEARFEQDAHIGERHPYQPPKDAAALVLLDRTGHSPKVLLGRRHPGHVFVPGALVFPGGRVDPTDRLMPTASPLDPRTQARLLRHVSRPSPDKARALALAAIRETFEETGLLLGSKHTEPPAAPAGPWRAFAQARVHPELSAIHFIARAVTPPRRPRRFDTRFFAIDTSAIAHRVDGAVGPHGELVELIWTPLSDVQRLDLLPITEIVLRDLQVRLAAGFGHDLPVPFYRILHGKRSRELL